MKPHEIKQAGIALLMLAALITLEGKSANGAYHQQVSHVDGVTWAAISVMFALLGLAGMAIAGTLKDDLRPWVQERCRWARGIAVAAIIVPTCFLASALKTENVTQRWQAYTAAGPSGEPSSYQLDQAIVADLMGDTLERSNARERIAKNRPGSVDLDFFDVELWIAAFFQGLLLLAADKLRIAAPMTDEEKIALGYKERGAKAAATRKRNAELRKQGVEPLKTPRRRKRA